MAYQNPNPHPLESGVTSASIRAQATLDWFVEVRKSIAELQRFLSVALGGGEDGVFAFGDDVDASLRVEPTSPVSMRVTCHAGWGIVDGVPFEMATDYTTPDFDTPVADDRIDVIAVSAVTRSIVIYTGNESSSPVAPAVTGEGEIKLAEIYHRPSETSIKATDDTTNGFNTDARIWVNR